MSYVVYLLECADGTYYTGVTTDIERRLVEHNTSSKGAKYTRSRRPIRVVYQETCESRAIAQKREHAIRRLPRTKKYELIKSQNTSPK